MPGVLANFGVLFAGYTYVVPDADDSTVTIDDATPASGGTVEVTVTALDGVTPAPFRGVRVTVAPSTNITVGTAPRTNKDGVSVIDIAVAVGAAATLRTITVSCGGVTLTDAPTFTPATP